jgi:hypothetical protein
MEKLINKFKESMLRAQIAATNFLTEERGDTNFISIAIILIVVIAIAIVFIKFGNDITDKLGDAIKDLFEVL